MGEPCISAGWDALPNELLAKIFISIRTARSCRLIQTDCAKWMPILLVCKRWNEVVSSIPELWRAITVSYPADIKTMHLCLARATPATLDIFLDEFRYDLDAVVQTLLPHAPRIRRLYIDFIPEPKFAAVEPLLRLAFPALEELSISQALGPRIDWGWEPALVDVNFPRLEKLYLEDSFFREKIPGSWHLRQLTLKRACDAVTSAVSLTPLLEILSACPLLEYLEVDGVPFNPEAEAPRINLLPRLRTLVLRHHSSLIYDFISRLASTTLTSVSVTGTGSSNASLRGHVPRDPSLLPPLRAAKHLEIASLTSMHSLVAHTDSECLSIRLEHPGGDSRTAARNLQSAIHDAHVLFADATILGLDIVGNVSLASAEWADLFLKFPSVRAFAVYGQGSTMEFLSALGQVSGDDGRRIPLPDLRTLRFNNSLLRPELLGELKECLEARAGACGAYLDEIRIGEWYLSHEHLVPLVGK